MSIGIAIHAFAGEETAKGVPAIVIRQFLRNAAATIVDITSLLRPERFGEFSLIVLIDITRRSFLNLEA